MEPAQSLERIRVIDSVRGVALLGILLVNMIFFGNSLQAISLGGNLWPGMLNEGLKLMQTLLIDGKFMGMFSFLFGLGMVIFRERALNRRERFIMLYTRRLLALLFFGLLHGIFIWYGDILFHYALLGFMLMLFHGRKPKTLLVWAILMLLLIPTLLTAASFSGGGTSSIDETKQMIQAAEYQVRDTQIYGNGTYADIARQRVNDFIASALNMVLFYPQILGMFLLGAYFGKRGMLHRPVLYVRQLRRIAVRCGGGGLLVSVLSIMPKEWTPSAVGTLLEIIGILIGAPLLSVGYIALIVLAFQKEKMQKLLLLFSYPGRMAFTNYIFQSIIGTFIFYSYGFGLFGQISPFYAFLLALGIYAFQMICSAWWLSHFRMGPLEWGWRACTYLRWSPFNG